MIATAISNHTQLLNYLAEKYKLDNYCEIGVQRPKNNFDKIACKWKVAIDPEIVEQPITGVAVNDTSDSYFKNRDDNYADKFDLIFIDGLHHADQVKRDFENSLRCLNEGGFIVIHDTMPEDESTTHVPRDSKMWHGDVYKFAMTLGLYGLKYFTVDMDCGCTVIKKDQMDGILQNINPEEFTPNWENFVKHKKYLLRVIAPTEIEQYF